MALLIFTSGSIHWILQRSVKLFSPKASLQPVFFFSYQCVTSWRWIVCVLQTGVLLWNSAQDHVVFFLWKLIKKVSSLILLWLLGVFSSVWCLCFGFLFVCLLLLSLFFFFLPAPPRQLSWAVWTFIRYFQNFESSSDSSSCCDVYLQYDCV